MADIQSNIKVNIDTSNALEQIKLLQSQISAFHTQMGKGGAAAAAQAAQLRQSLINGINATGKFNAQMTSVKTSTEYFTNALEKNKLTMGEYFRYAGGASKTFGKLFKSEFETINKVARERVKDLQTQYIKMGRDANGAMKAIKVRPLMLDMDNLGTKTAIAAQRQQLLNQLLKQGSTNMLNFGKNTQWAGRQLMVGFTVPLTMLGSIAVKSFKEMEEAVIKFKRVYGDLGTTNEETNKMAANLKSLAESFTKYGVAVKDTMDMAATAAATGKMGADLVAQVSSATKLAVLGGVDQQKALETTISLTNAFGLSAEDLAKKIDFLNAVENQTVLSIDDLTTAIPKAAPVIQQLGGNVEDLAFFLTAMKEGGINASEGANALKSGLASMINPTNSASKMLAGFGINIKGIVQADKGNLKKTVVDFASALDKLDPLNRARAIEQMFGKFQFARLSTLFKNVVDQNSQASRALGLTKATTEELAILSERELKKVSDSPLYKYQKAMKDFQNAMVPIGEQFLKALTPILNFVNGMLKQFDGLGDGAKSFVVGFTAVLGGIAPVVLMVVGLVANGIANLIKLFANFKAFFNNLGKSSKDLGASTKYMTSEQIEAAAIASSLDQVHGKLTQTFTSEAEAIQLLVAEYQKAARAQAAFNQTAMLGGVGGARKYANGGIIVGPGTGTSDSIVARVSNGEAVIPAQSVSKHPDLVKGLISGNIPAFASGGFVMPPRMLQREIGPQTQAAALASENKALALQAMHDEVMSSEYANMAAMKLSKQLSPSGGHSFITNRIGGIYELESGEQVFIKPQVNLTSALAELRGTKIAREAHGLIAPEQKLRVIFDPTDPEGKRKLFALESPLNEKIANPSSSFTRKEYFKQLTASLLRGDKDLQAANLGGSVLADVGPSGVFAKASRNTEMTTAIPSMEEQAMINLLGVKGRAKKWFAQATSGIAREMSPIEYHNAMLEEINSVLPKLKATVANMGLTNAERPYYEAMVARLESGRGVDWSKFQQIHAAVPSFAGGGMISGPGSGTSDSIIARVSNGEAIIPAKSVAKNPELVRGLIAGNIPGFSSGVVYQGSHGSMTNPSNYSAYLNQLIAYEPALAQMETVLYETTQSLDGVITLSKKMSTVGQIAARDFTEVYASGSLFAGTARIEPSTTNLAYNQIPYSGPGNAGGAVPGYAMTLDEQVLHGRAAEEALAAQRAGTLKLTQSYIPAIEELAAKGRNASLILSDASLADEARTAHVLENTRLMTAQGLISKNNMTRAQAEAETERELALINEKLVAARARGVSGQELQNIALMESGVMMTRKFGNEFSATAVARGTDSSAFYAARDNAKGAGMEATQSSLDRRAAEFAATGKQPRRRLQIRGDWFGENRFGAARGKNAPAIASKYEQEGFQVRTNPQIVMKNADEDSQTYLQRVRRSIANPINDFYKMIISTSRHSPHPEAPLNGEQDATAYNSARRATNAEFDITEVEAAKARSMSMRAISAEDGIQQGSALSQARLAELMEGLTVSDELVAKHNVFNIEESAKTGAAEGVAHSEARTAAARVENAEVLAIYREGRAAELAVMQEQNAMLMGSGVPRPGFVAGGTTTLVQPVASDYATRAEAIKAEKEYQKKVAQSNKQNAKAAKGGGGGKGMGAMMALSMLPMAASAIPGDIGKAAQENMMPLMALSMLPMILPMLSTPLGVIVAVLGSVAAAFLMLRNAFDETQKKVIENGNAFKASTEAIQKYAVFNNKVTASELRDRERAASLSPYGVKPGKTTFGEAFAQSEAGKDLSNKLSKLTAAGDKLQAEKDLTSQLATAILSGAMDMKQAKSIAVNVAKSAGDISIGTQAISRLEQILGAEGGKAISNPVGVRLKLMKQQEEQQKQSLGTMNASINSGDRFNATSNQQLAGVSAGVAGGAAVGAGIGAALTSWLGPGAAAGALIGAAIGGIAGGIGTYFAMQESVQKIAKFTAATSIDAKILLETNKQLLDSYDLQYEKKHQQLIDQGKIVEANKLENDYLEKRKKLTDQIKTSQTTLVKQYNEQGNLQEALMSGAKKASDAKYKDNANELAYLDVARQMASDLVSSKTISGGQQYLIELKMAAGDLPPSQARVLLDFMTKNTDMAPQTMKIVTKFAGQESSQAAQILAMIKDTGVQKEFIQRVSVQPNDESAKRLLDVFSNIEQANGVFNVDMQIGYFSRNAGAKNSVIKDFEDINKAKLKTGTDISKIVSQTDYQSNLGMTNDYFAKLNKNQKNTYTKVISQVMNVKVDATAAGDDFKAWQKEDWTDSDGIKRGGVQWKDKSIAWQVSRYADDMAAKTVALGIDLASATMPTSTDTGTGTEPQASFLDQIVKGYRDAFNWQQKLTVGFTKSKAVIDGFMAKGFNGLAVQLAKAGVGAEAIQQILDAPQSEIDQIVDKTTGKIKTSFLKTLPKLAALNSFSVANITTRWLTMNKDQQDQERISMYQAGLEVLKGKEDKVNKIYDERVKLLDKVQSLNDKTNQQEQDKLSLADALSRGDIAAAARAAQQMKQNNAKAAIEATRESLQNARQAELDALTVTVGGKKQSRVEIEQNILTLTTKINAHKLIQLNREIAIGDELDRQVTAAQTLAATGKGNGNGGGGDGGGNPGTPSGKEKEKPDVKKHSAAWLTANKTHKALLAQMAVEVKTQNTLAGKYPGISSWDTLSGADLNRLSPEEKIARQYYMQAQSKINSILPKIISTENRMKTIGYADGGHIRGVGSGTSDSIPAMLSNGEYVIRADAVKTIGVDALNRLNQADKMKFANGGMAKYMSGGMARYAGGGYTDRSNPEYWDARKRYIMHKDEYLWLLAERFLPFQPPGTTLNDFAQQIIASNVNPNSGNPSRLSIGEHVFIPGITDVFPRKSGEPINKINKKKKSNIWGTDISLHESHAGQGGGGLGGGLLGVMTKMYANGGMVIPRFKTGGYVGMMPRFGDGGLANLHQGEYVFQKSAVDRIGINSLNAMNQGETSMGDSVYNYNINLNVSSMSDQNDIADAVLTQIRRLDSQRIRRTN